MIKRKTNKRMLAVLVMMAMMLSLVATAFALGLPPEKGDLYIHKFIGTTQTGTNNGTELNTSGWTAIPANNVVFDIYKVGDAVTNSPAWLDIPPIGNYAINASEQLVVTDDSEVVIGIYELGTATQVTTAKVNGEDGVAVAKDLDQGIYLVIENVQASRDLGVTDPNGKKMFISSAVQNFLVAVPMTDPNGTDWLTKVHVYPKNAELSIEKEVSNPSITVGDVVTYTLKASVPADIDSGVKFSVTDKLDIALDYVVNSVVVKTSPVLTEAISPSDYVVSYDSTERILKVDIKPTAFARLKEATKLIVEFDAKVNANVLGKVKYTVGNTGSVQFTNSQNTDFEADSNNEDIHTSAIKIIKVDNQNPALFLVAEFKIATSLANAKAGNFLRKDTAGTYGVAGQLYDYDASTSSTWYLLGSGSDLIATTNGVTGEAKFEGLYNKKGNDYQTYYLVETKAPTGYNLLSSAKAVPFIGNETDYTVEVTVKNSKGFVLPITGDAGTVFLTVSGIMLLSLGVYVATKKRKENEVKA